MATQKRSFLYSAIILTASGIGLQLLGFAYKVFLGRATGPEGMGVYQLVMPVYSVIFAIALSGLCTAVTALSSRHRALGRDGANVLLVRMALALFLLLMAACAVPVAAASGWISDKILGNTQTQLSLLLLLPCLTLTGVENVVKSHFYGVDNVKLPAASDQMEQIVRIVAVVALLAAVRPQTPGAASALIIAGMTISELFSATFLSAQFWRRHRGQRVERGQRRPMLGKIVTVALPVSAAALASNLLHTANTVLLPRRLMVSGMAPGESLGALGVLMGMAMPLFFLPAVFVGPLSMLLLPKLSEGNALKKLADVRRKISKSIHVVGLLALPAIALIVPLGPSLCTLLYQQHLSEGYFLAIAVGTVISYYQSITSSILNGMEMQRRAMVHTFLGGGVQLSFTWFAVADPRLRITGFLLGLAAGALITTALNLHCILAKTGVRLEWGKQFVMPVLSAVITGMTARLVFGMVGPALPVVGALAVSALAGGLAFLVTLWIQGIEVGRYARALLPEFGLQRHNAAASAYSMMFFF